MCNIHKIQNQVACLLLLIHTLVGCGSNIEINNTVESSSEVHDSFRYGNSPIYTSLKPFPIDNKLVVVGEVLEVSVTDITSSSQQRSELSNLLSIMQPTIPLDPFDKSTQSNQPIATLDKRFEENSFYIGSDRNQTSSEPYTAHAGQQRYRTQQEKFSEAKSTHADTGRSLMITTSAPFIVTTRSNHQVTLTKQDDTWIANIQDGSFQGFYRELTLPVYPEQGICIERLAEQGKHWQRNHIWIVFPEQVHQNQSGVYIGNWGMRGGGNSGSSTLVPKPSGMLCNECGRETINWTRISDLNSWMHQRGEEECLHCTRKAEQRMREEQRREEEERRREEERKREYERYIEERKKYEIKLEKLEVKLEKIKSIIKRTV